MAFSIYVVDRRTNQPVEGTKADNIDEPAQVAFLAMDYKSKFSPHDYEVTIHSTSDVREERLAELVTMVKDKGYNLRHE